MLVACIALLFLQLPSLSCLLFLRLPKSNMPQDNTTSRMQLFPAMFMAPDGGGQRRDIDVSCQNRVTSLITRRQAAEASSHPLFLLFFSIDSRLKDLE
jgi:hypothetical protein